MAYSMYAVLVVCRPLYSTLPCHNVHFVLLHDLQGDGKVVGLPKWQPIYVSPSMQPTRLTTVICKNGAISGSTAVYDIFIAQYTRSA